MGAFVPPKTWEVSQAYITISMLQVRGQRQGHCLVFSESRSYKVVEHRLIQTWLFAHCMSHLTACRGLLLGKASLTLVVTLVDPLSA